MKKPLTLLMAFFIGLQNVRCQFVISFAQHGLDREKIYCFEGIDGSGKSTQKIVS